MRRALSSAALVLAVGLSAAACGDDGSGEATESPSASPTATAWSADAKPQRPKDEHSDAGAQAFAEFVADTVFYVMATSDVPALTSISDLTICANCKAWNDNHRAGKVKEKTIASGPVTHRLVDEPSVNDDVYYQVRLMLDVPPGRSVVVRDDGTKRTEEISAAKDLPFKADVLWKDGAWQLLRYQMGDQVH